jgi:hypothetical protein
VTTPATFTVAYSDLDYMQMWCSACLEEGLRGKADLLRYLSHSWDTEWPLERLNELAAAHLKAVHPVQGRP